MSLIAELKRRNVFRVGVAYAIVAWLLVEVASVVLPTFEAPDWVMKVYTFPSRRRWRARPALSACCSSPEPEADAPPGNHGKRT